MAAKKTAAKKPAVKNNAAKVTTQPAPSKQSAADPSPLATPPRISIRMYRQGLGDCFLITFPVGPGRPFYLLIDCGVVLGTPDPATRMKRVVGDIAQVTNSQIDLLVVTHEHWDHVSGFNQVQDLFENLKIQQVWVAWTEDPNDPLANKLRAERRTAEDALRIAVTHLALAGDTDTAQRVDSLIGFFGATAGSTGAALDYAKKRAPGGRPRYCQPGEPAITLPELPDVRFWVLGPPKDEKLIKKSNPSQNEAYGLDAGPDGSQALLIAGLLSNMGDAADTSLLDSSIEDPFDDIYSIPMERAEHLPFFKKHYYGNSNDGSIYENRSVTRSMINRGAALTRRGWKIRKRWPCNSIRRLTIRVSSWRSN
jgi:hypothetical protein